MTTTLLALGGVRAGSPAGLAVLALALADAGGLALILWRALLAGRVVARALSRDLGVGQTTGESGGRPPRRRLPLRTVFWPLPLGTRGVKRIANVSYGPAGRGNRLDLYLSRPGPVGAPMFVHFHGGRG